MGRVRRVILAGVDYAEEELELAKREMAGITERLFSEMDDLNQRIADAYL